MKHPFRVLASIVTILFLAACSTTPTVEPEVPENVLASQYIRLGIGYMQEGKFELALTRLERALELDPKSAEAHEVLGILHERLNQHDQAEDHFKQALRLDPQFSHARTNYGSFLCRRGRTEEAEAQFRRAIELDDGLVPLLYLTQVKDLKRYY